jgi:hypothetical protein
LSKEVTDVLKTQDTEALKAPVAASKTHLIRKA